MFYRHDQVEEGDLTVIKKNKKSKGTKKAKLLADTTRCDEDTLQYTQLADGNNENKALLSESTSAKTAKKLKKKKRVKPKKASLSSNVLKEIKPFDFSESSQDKVIMVPVSKMSTKTPMKSCMKANYTFAEAISTVKVADVAKDAKNAFKVEDQCKSTSIKKLVDPSKEALLVTMTTTVKKQAKQSAGKVKQIIDAFENKFKKVVYGRKGIAVAGNKATIVT